MSNPGSTHPPHPHKLPGWLAPLAVVIALGAGGWFVWQQFDGSPSTGERFELAPEPEARARGRSLAESAARALSNLGRGRAAAATRPATAPR